MLKTPIQMIFGYIFGRALKGVPTTLSGTKKTR